MKKYVLAALIAIGTVACSSTTESERNRAATNNRVDTDRTDWESRMQARLERIERNISEWKNRDVDPRAERAKDATKVQTEKRMNDLEKLKDETREGYNKLKQESAEGWSTAKAKTEQGLDRLEREWDEFVASVRN